MSSWICGRVIHKLSCGFPNEMCDGEVSPKIERQAPEKLPTSDGYINSQHGCTLSKSAFLQVSEWFGSFIVDEQRFGYTTFVRLSIIDSQMDCCNFPETNSKSSWKWTVRRWAFPFGMPYVQGVCYSFQGALSQWDGF